MKSAFDDNTVTVEAVYKDNRVRITITRPKTMSQGRYTLKADLQAKQAVEFATQILREATSLDN